MKVVLIGAVEFSFAMLETLISHKAEVVGVITTKKNLINDDFKDLTPLCTGNGIPIHYTNDINSAETISWLVASECHIVFCCGWSSLIKAEIIGTPRFGVIGYHPSALPKNRGRHPLIWTLVLGLKESASTFFLIDEGVDSGQIVSQRFFVVNPDDNARSLYNKIVDFAKIQIIEIMDQLKHGSLSLAPQDLSSGNIWRKRSYEDGQIDWRMSASMVCNLVRGLSEPYCGAHLKYCGSDITVTSCNVVNISNLENIEPGFIVKVLPEGKLIIKCGSGCVEIEPIRPLRGVKKGGYL